jgi:hypothetical protein
MVSHDLSALEKLLCLDDEAYLRTTLDAHVTATSEVDEREYEFQLIADAFREFKTTSVTFEAWARTAKKLSVCRRRERERTAAVDFFIGRRRRGVAVRCLRAWRATARRCARLRALTRRVETRWRTTRGTAALVAWAAWAASARVRRKQTLDAATRRRDVRTMRSHVRLWRERTRRCLSNDRATVWRALKLESTAFAGWTRFVVDARAAHEATRRAIEHHERAIKRRAVRRWRAKLGRARAFTNTRVVAVRFVAWWRRVEDARELDARMRFAVRHDDVRLTVGAFARWCVVTREIRAHKRDVARAEKFHRETLKAGTFFAWRAATKCARTLNAERRTRAFERWRAAVVRMRELEARARFFLDSQAISFNDKYMPESCFGVWRDFVYARRRRYAAMEFEETWRARRAFATWRLTTTTTTRDDDAKNVNEDENESSNANVDRETLDAARQPPAR